MVRRGSKLGVATVVPLIVGAVLTALAVSRHTYEAEATLFTSTSTEKRRGPRSRYVRCVGPGSGPCPFECR